MKTKKILALFLTLAMLIGMIPATMFTVTANAEITTDEGETQEYPRDGEYDFSVPGSTISFLDKDGVLMTEEQGWYDGEYLVHTWYVFMYRTDKDDLKLGYSPEGELFLPHKVYEGDTADLLYVKNNNLFRVTATKDAEQTFDGSQILKTISLQATNGTVTLANAPVYAETPFGFVYMGVTDEQGSFSVNATIGEFKLWISSNAGYILNKTVTVTDSTTEISFADEITNAVEIDVTERSETYSKAPGYIVALGKPNESESKNMITTSYVAPEKTVFVTPGTYSIACGIWFKDQSSYYSTETSGGLWIDLAKNETINQKTTYHFSVADFEVKYEIQDDYKQDSYGLDELMVFKFCAEHPDGYVIPGRAHKLYDSDGVTVTVGENEYPYTFCWSIFDMSSAVNVYKKGDDTILDTWRIGDNEVSLPMELFGETENEYVVKYYSDWDSQSFPWLFPKDVWYSTTVKTSPLDVPYRTFESDESFDVYYIDENGDMVEAVCDHRDSDGKYLYTVPGTVKNGDCMLAVSWVYDMIQYSTIPVSNALFANGYKFVEQTNYSKVNFTVKNGENDEASYDTTFDLTIEAGNREFKICGIEAGKEIPYGEYLIEVHASSPQYDEEYNEIGNTIVLHTEKRTLSEASCTINVDYSAYKSFTIGASAFPVVKDFMYNYKKNIALHYADGSVKNVDWEASPATLYCSTMPEYATGEMYYYAFIETEPFSPYVSLERFEIEEGKTYQFDFKPTAIEITGSTVFGSNENTVLTYRVTDGFGNVLNDIWNLLNEGGVHNPLRSREYPFRDEEGNPVDNHYPVDVYLREKGESEYKKMSSTDFSKADLGRLKAGEYEGYIEINFDTYLDEYIVEYPMEKGVYYNEWQGDFISVYDNINRVLHGVLQKDFTFTVDEKAHTCEFGDWIDDEVTETHTRTCKNPTCGKTETEDHKWDDGVQNGTPACTVGAAVTYTCTGCGKTRTENVDKLGHNWSSWTFIDGRSHKKICSRCNGVEAASHHFDAGVVTKKATLLEKGVKSFTCTDGCGYSYTEEIPVLSAKGKVFTDKQGSKYKVTKSGAKSGEVTFEKPKSSAKGTVKVPDTVTIGGITYKVTVIGANAFKNNKKITKVTIGNNVTVIGKNAFAGCKKLSSVTIGKKVKTISAGAFSGCVKLKTITVKSTKLKSVGKKALKGIYAKAKIKVPKSKLTKYKSLFKNKGQGKNVKVTR